MKRIVPVQRSRCGVGLIETVGVLAIVATLTGLMTPLIVASINTARVNSALAGCRSIQARAIGYFAEHGRFGDSIGEAIDLDSQLELGLAWGRAVLAKARFIDAAFHPRLGSSVLSSCGLSGVAATISKSACSRNGADIVQSTAPRSKYVLETDIAGLALEDVPDLNLSLEGGGLLAEQNDDGSDLVRRGKCVFLSGAQASEVRMCITHPLTISAGNQDPP